MRKIIQIQLDPGPVPCLFVLCDDGTLWQINWYDGKRMVEQVVIPQ